MVKTSKSRDLPEIDPFDDIVIDPLDAVSSFEDCFLNYEKPKLSLFSGKIPALTLPKVECQATLEKINAVLEEAEIRGIADSYLHGYSHTEYRVRLREQVACETLELLLCSLGEKFKAPVRAFYRGKSGRALSFEIANKKRTAVSLRSLLKTGRALPALSLPLGKNARGEAVTLDLQKNVGLLISGCFGSGKTTLINSLLTSLLFKTTPPEARLLVVKSEEKDYAHLTDVPHLLSVPLMSGDYGLGAICWAAIEAERRVALLGSECIKNFTSFNKSVEKGKTDYDTLPYVFVVIDGLDCIMEKHGALAERLLEGLFKNGKKVGMRFIISTESVEEDILPEALRRSLGAGIALRQEGKSSEMAPEKGDSELLLGEGDMLFTPKLSDTPHRIQGAICPDGDLFSIGDYLKRQSGAGLYDEDVIEEIASLSIRLGKSSYPKGQGD